jgi:hypothetical protein
LLSRFEGLGALTTNQRPLPFATFSPEGLRWNLQCQSDFSNLKADNHLVTEFFNVVANPH